jgi:hypothetical protein
MEEVMWGIGLIAVSLLIHGFGMIATLHISTAFKQRTRTPDSFVVGMASIILGSWLIMLVHIAENHDCGPGSSTGKTASRPSAPRFTLPVCNTPRWGSSLNLPKEWRLLEIMTASAGLLGFAWSTGVLMTLAQEFQEQQLRLLRERAARTGQSSEDEARSRSTLRRRQRHRTTQLDRLARTAAPLR